MSAGYRVLLFVRKGQEILCCGETVYETLADASYAAESRLLVVWGDDGDDDEDHYGGPPTRADVSVILDNDTGRQIGLQTPEYAAWVTKVSRLLTTTAPMAS